MTVMVNQTGQYHFYSSNLVLILTMNQSLFRGQICHDRCPFYLSAACFLPLTSLPCVAGSNTLRPKSLWNHNGGRRLRRGTKTNSRSRWPTSWSRRSTVAWSGADATDYGSEEDGATTSPGRSLLLLWLSSFSFAPCRWMRWWGS